MLVTFPSHWKKLRSILRYWLEKLNCGFCHSFHSWKNTTKQLFTVVENNYRYVHSIFKCLLGSSLSVTTYFILYAEWNLFVHNGFCLGRRERKQRGLLRLRFSNLDEWRCMRVRWDLGHCLLLQWAEIGKTVQSIMVCMIT